MDHHQPASCPTNSYQVPRIPCRWTGCPTGHFLTHKLDELQRFIMAWPHINHWSTARLVASISIAYTDMSWHCKTVGSPKISTFTSATKLGTPNSWRTIPWCKLPASPFRLKFTLVRCEWGLLNLCPKVMNWLVLSTAKQCYDWFTFPVVHRCNCPAWSYELLGRLVTSKRWFLGCCRPPVRSLVILDVWHVLRLIPMIVIHSVEWNSVIIFCEWNSLIGSSKMAILG